MKTEELVHDIFKNVYQHRTFHDFEAWKQNSPEYAQVMEVIRTIERVCSSNEVPLPDILTSDLEIYKQFPYDNQLPPEDDDLTNGKHIGAKWMREWAVKIITEMNERYRMRVLIKEAEIELLKTGIDEELLVKLPTGYNDANGKIIIVGQTVKIQCNPYFGNFEVKFGRYKLKPFSKTQVERAHHGFYLRNGSEILPLPYVVEQPKDPLASTHRIEIIE